MGNARFGRLRGRTGRCQAAAQMGWHRAGVHARALMLSCRRRAIAWHNRFTLDNVSKANIAANQQDFAFTA